VRARGFAFAQSVSRGAGGVSARCARVRGCYFTSELPRRRRERRWRHRETARGGRRTSGRGRDAPRDRAERGRPSAPSPGPPGRRMSARRWRSSRRRQVDFEIDADRALENNLVRIEPRPLAVVVDQEGLVRPDARELHWRPPRLLRQSTIFEWPVVPSARRASRCQRDFARGAQTRRD
jgi:hypothetical protein